MLLILLMSVFMAIYQYIIFRLPRGKKETCNNKKHTQHMLLSSSDNEKTNNKTTPKHLNKEVARDSTRTTSKDVSSITPKTTSMP
jgi:hypothetical protein